MEANSETPLKCACRSRSCKDLRPCIECNYEGNFCPDCPHCQGCGRDEPGYWFCKSCQGPISFEKKYQCVNCETYHCAECVFVCDCGEEEGLKHYVCDDEKHRCLDPDCENYVCSNAWIYRGVCICNDHTLPVGKRILKRVVEEARAHKRVRDELTEQLWAPQTKKKSM
jgi:hypothetical protein